MMEHRKLFPETQRQEWDSPWYPWIASNHYPEPDSMGCKNCFYKNRCEAKMGVPWGNMINNVPNTASKVHVKVEKKHQQCPPKNCPKAPGRQHLHSQKENSSSYPQFFRVQAVPFRFWVTGAFILDKKLHHFPIDSFTCWVFYRIVPMRFRCTISKKTTTNFLRIYFFGNTKLFSQKSASFFQPPFRFAASHWIEVSHDPMGKISSRDEGWTHSLLWESAKWFLCGYTGHPFREGRSWWWLVKGWWKVGEGWECFFLDRQYLAGCKCCSFLLCNFLLVNDWFFSRWLNRSQLWKDGIERFVTHQKDHFGYHVPPIHIYPHTNSRLWLNSWTHSNLTNQLLFWLNMIYIYIHT